MERHSFHRSVAKLSFQGILRESCSENFGDFMENISGEVLLEESCNLQGLTKNAAQYIIPH